MIPYFCALEGDATDEALKKDCFTVLYVLASAQQKESTLDYLINILVDIKANGSWHARMFLLRFLQIMVFTNLPMLKVGWPYVFTDHCTLARCSAHLLPCFTFPPLGLSLREFKMKNTRPSKSTRGRP